MRPEDSSPQSQPTVRVPSRDTGYSLVPDRPTPASARSSRAAQDATANLARQQIDDIYSNDPNALMPDEPAAATPTDTPQPSAPTHAYALTDEDRHDQQQAEPTPILHGKAKFGHDRDVPVEQLLEANPYDRSHDEAKLQANDKQWKQYHTAWQQYYQQYFHQYYAGHIQQMQTALEQKHAAAPQAASEVTPEQAMADISSSLRGKVQQRAKKFRKSRHFTPIIAAACVMMVFAFLQYNRVLFANINAYVVPSSLDPSNLIVDPTKVAEVGPEPRLLIPKVNIDVPVVWDARPDHASQMAAMEHGVAWFGIPGANSRPGQVGNTVLSGHSSNDFLETGNYKFVFAPLHRVTEGDTIHINYEGTRFTYTVTRIEVVRPTDVDALRRPTDKPILTLITCTPLGTALNRLLVTAEQVLPNPADAAPAPSGDNSGAAAEMPGVQPTVIERMFGAQ